MRKLFTLLLLGIAPQVDAQSDYPRYYRLSHQAATAHHAGHPDSAWALYTSAFAVVDTPLRKELRDAHAAAIGLRKQNPKAFEAIAFQSHVYDSIADEQEKTYDRDYARFIGRLIKEDQRVRRKKYRRAMHEWKSCLADPQCDKSSKSFLAAQRLGLELRQADSSNIHQLLTRINGSGFPSARRVGTNAADEAFILMLHFDRDSLNTTLGPVIRSAFENGELRPESYAHIIDRRLRSGQRKEPYYYQIPVGNALNNAEAVDEINQRRLNIGLPPIAESFSISTRKRRVVARSR